MSSENLKLRVLKPLNLSDNLKRIKREAERLKLHLRRAMSTTRQFFQSHLSLIPAIEDYLVQV
jgi:hypothetical protein